MKKNIKNKILLENFPEPSKVISFTDDARLLIGFEAKKNEAQTREQLISDILISLLIHEKICINSSKLPALVILFGFEHTINLLKNGYFELIDDKNQGIGLRIDKDCFRVTSVHLVSEDKKRRSGIELLEDNLNKFFPLKKEQVNLLLFNAEKNIISINEDEIRKNVLNELDYDLNNGNLIKINENIRNTSNKIIGINPYTVLRLIHINQAIIHASTIDSPNILLDGGVKSVIQKKFSPVSNKFQNGDSVQVFKNILIKKGLPDLSKLILTGVLSINDIINLRENINNKKFRDWFYTEEYNEDKIIETLLKNNHSLSKNIFKYIRWAIPTSIGIANTPLGVAASYLDSFIVDKIFNGWSPNLFLDNVLKTKIDNAVKKYDINKKNELISKRFPKLGRNDKCSCGSHKKFKKCCGKI